MAPVDTVAVVLAAGAGHRFRDTRHKLHAVLPARASDPEEAVVTRSLRRAVEAAIGPVVVITGAVPLDLPDEITGHVTEVHNPDWEAGQSTSVAVGIDLAASRGATAVVVGLGDQPGVTADAWRTVAAGRHPLTVATYDGVRGNPVRLSAEVWPLLPREGDEVGRAVMRVHPELVGEVACTGSAGDIDTLEDLRRWQSN